MIIVLGILSFVGAGLVRWWMKRTYDTWSRVPNAIGVNGHRVARHILDSNGLQVVQLEVTPGQLSDHYIPSQKRIRLSEFVNNQPSVASIAVAAHEVGHALQDAADYQPLRLKAIMMPIAALGNQGGIALALAGTFLSSPVLTNIGMLLLGSGVFMQVLTLPIEFDASKRALAQLTRLQLVDQRDYAGARSMLRAAALTYVASAASSFAFMAFIFLRFFKR